MGLMRWCLACGRSLQPNAVDTSWKSPLRAELNPEIKRLMKLVDAHTDRYVRMGTLEDLHRARQLRLEIRAMKQRVICAEVSGARRDDEAAA